MIACENLADRHGQQIVGVRGEMSASLFKSLAVYESFISRFYIKIPLDLKLCVMRDK